jgi:hypothetical protein
MQAVRHVAQALQGLTAPVVEAQAVLAKTPAAVFRDQVVPAVNIILVELQQFMLAAEQLKMAKTAQVVVQPILVVGVKAVELVVKVATEL